MKNKACPHSAVITCAQTDLQTDTWVCKQSSHVLDPQTHKYKQHSYNMKDTCLHWQSAHWLFSALISCFHTFIATCGDIYILNEKFAIVSFMMRKLLIWCVCSEAVQVSVTIKCFCHGFNWVSIWNINYSSPEQQNKIHLKRVFLFTWHKIVKP